MQITKSEIKDLTGVITMVVEPADYQEEVQKELRHIRQKANIPGFRPGMVPMGMVKKMYGKGVLAEVINKTIGAKLGEYIEAEKLNILGDPLPNEELTPEMDLDNQDTFTFAFDIAVAPEFEAKLDGKTKLPKYVIDVTDEMVNKQVEAYANRFGEYIPEDKEKGTKAEVKPCKVDAELFAKVYGENAPKDEAEFRAKVKEDIAQSLEKDCEYRFGLDVKAAILKKMEKVEFPNAFLRRWVLSTNKEMTEEQVDKDFDAMLKELKWHLAKDQLMKAFEIKVEKEDVEAFAKEVARLQFTQYGLMHIDDQYLTNYANEMLKNENQLRGIVERVAENKIYEAVKGVAKVEEKKISHEDFGKLFKD